MTTTDRVVTADPTGNLPDEVRARVAANLVAPAQAEGAALYKTLGNVVSVSAYGALGDGTTDDTTAIAAALVVARAAGATLVFGAGQTYIVSAQLAITGATIDGQGATLKVKAGVTQSWPVLNVTGACVVKNLNVDLNKANTTDPANTAYGMALYAYNATGWTGSVVMRDVKVINGYQPALRFGTQSSGLLDANNTPASAVHLENVSVDSCKYGVYAFGIAGLTVINANISNTSLCGIQDILSRGTEIVGGRVSNTGDHAIVTTYSVGFRCTGVRVETTTGGGGIVVGGGSTTIAAATRFTITGNVVKGATTSGIQVDTTISGASTTPVPCYGTVSGNMVSACTVHGFYFHNAQYLAVTGNTATGCGNGGMAFDSLNLAISGNTLVANVNGMKFQGAVSGYGSHAIGRNVVTGNSTANYVFDTHGADDTALDLYGTGSPASVVAAPVGSRFMRTDGGTSTVLYIKESGGVANTGWVAK